MDNKRLQRDLDFYKTLPPGNAVLRLRKSIKAYRNDTQLWTRKSSQRKFSADRIRELRYVLRTLTAENTEFVTSSYEEAENRALDALIVSAYKSPEALSDFPSVGGPDPELDPKDRAALDALPSVKEVIKQILQKSVGETGDESKKNGR